MELLFVTLAHWQLLHALHLGHKTEITRRHMHDAARGLATTEIDLERPRRSISWWKLPNTNNRGIDVPKGQQIRPFDHNVSENNNDGPGLFTSNLVCPISRCPSDKFLDKVHCGEHARCIGDLCQCDLGWKPIGSTSMTRGWSGLEALTVWADAYTAGCTERCDGLACSEVPQIRGCFDGSTIHSDKNEGKEKSQTDQESPSTDDLHLGAIKAPAADPGTGG